MDSLIEGIENLSLQDSLPLLSSFVENNENSVCSPQIDDNVRERLWYVLFKHLDENSTAANLLCLKAIRILSREKQNISKYVSEERLKKLYTLSKIQAEPNKDNCSLEALKCLCNLTYNMPIAADVLHSFDATTHLAEKLNSYSKNSKEQFERKLSEMKLLFLITSFCSSSRELLFTKYGLHYFIELCMKEGRFQTDIINESKKKIQLSFDQLSVLSQILKTTFNVLIIVKTEQLDNKDEFKKFTALSRELILIGLNSETAQLISDVVNVLTLMPLDCLSWLIIPLKQIDESNIENSPGLEAVSVLVQFLDSVLTKLEQVPATPKEDLSPITLLLTNMAKSNKHYRKYIRAKVLPNLKEVYTRPEVGTTLRNKLCRLLTSPLTATRDLVADFLFVLCKESVARMVKYTGYGNAAGLFANRGLLATNDGATDSEDSDTEEYLQKKHMINPVVGCVTPPRANEIANMTEEQKEYLAMELVNKIDKLHREGLIQPCRVGPDGKPAPVEHVLELQETVPSELIRK